jgi:LCP family protein required for cell wall assembly
MVTTAALLSLLSAALVWVAQQQLENRQIVALAATPPATTTTTTTTPAAPAPVDTVALDEVAPEVTQAAEPAPVETFPQAEPEARNILITGADNNACLDPDSRFAPAFGDRQGAGERSDTIMMWRVSPETGQVAVLSFPRDLWLNIDGRSSKGRINEAYERDNPQRLINTISQNFGIQTDHFVQVDFCAFKELVDAVDGVAVPFETPVRDGATGLIVEEAGCFTFTGEHALAYVRSRKMEFLNPDGVWQRDGTSDLGRISRQQDFIRRVGDELLSNAFSPDVVRSLIDVSREYIVTDNELTVDKILQFASVLQTSDPATITTYQIEAVDRMIQGNAVLEPRIGGDNMQAVLALFRGEVALGERPEQNLPLGDAATATTEVTATTVPVESPTATTMPPFVPTTPAPTTAPLFEEPVGDFGGLESTVPVVETENIIFGVVPDSTQSCT